MAFEPESLGLSPAGLPLLRDLIHERTGLFYDNGRYDSFTDRIAPLVLERGFRSFLDFYYLLKYEEHAPGGEWRRVMDALSVQETYFWREIAQIQGFVRFGAAGARACHDRSADPHLERAVRDGRRTADDCHGAQRGRLVRADTASRFTRATRAVPRSPRPVSARIASGRSARCRRPCARSISSATTARGVPIPELRERIASWSVVNLAAPEEIAPYASSPVIFCRNAFIYFSPSSVRAVVDALADRMPVPSYLFVGASESLLNVTNRFMLEDLEEAFVYVKR